MSQTATFFETATRDFLQWAKDASGALHLVREPALTCPRCGDGCGYLYHANADGEELCLSCHLDEEAIRRYEEREADEFWGQAEMACSTCGID